MHIKILNYILNSKYKSYTLAITTGLLFFILNFIWPVPTLTVLWWWKVIPDLLTFGGNYEYIYNLFTQLGTTGRQEYLLFLYTLDVIFPIAYSLFFGLLLWLSIRNININEQAKYLLTSFSFIAACFDYIENISYITLLHTFPTINQTVVHIGTISTIFKNMFSFIGMSLLLGFTLYNIYNKLLKNNKICL